MTKDKKPQRKNKEVTSVSVRQHYSGILPPAEQFEKYEIVCPGAAEQILSHATQQINHRIKMEDKLVSADIQIQKTGLFLAYSLILIVFIFGFILILTDKKVEGLSTLATALFTIGALFVYRQKKQEKKEHRN